MNNPAVYFGELGFFCLHTIRGFAKLPRRMSNLWIHCLNIGNTSVGIVAVAGVFLGAVIGYQFWISFHRFGFESLLGGSVGVALFRELGPVMTGVMVVGRAGASIAAELATMRINEEIEALEVMGIDAIEYLVTPRILAGFMTVPILGLIFSLVGSASAAGIACGVLDLPFSTFISQYKKFTDGWDVLHCVVKSAVFGVLLAQIACFYGFRARGGAQAVGQATRDTVVTSLLMLLLADYFITSLLPLGLSSLEAVS